MQKKIWKLILILWPSGVWKWTLISLLKKRKNPEKYFFPISCTTRKPRLIKETWEFEKDGENYFFISKEEFEKKIENWDFLEYAHVHWETYYWTLKKPILDAINEWKIVIREIDVQGFETICKNFDKTLLWSVFIDIPPLHLLKNRIRARAPISEEELQKRMESMQKELVYRDEVDFIVKNIENGVEEMYEDLEFKIGVISDEDLKSKIKKQYEK